MNVHFKKANLKVEILSLPSSIFRSHCKGCFHIWKLTFMLQCEHMVAFSILGKKGDRLVILVCVTGRLLSPRWLLLYLLFNFLGRVLVFVCFRTVVQRHLPSNTAINFVALCWTDSLVNYIPVSLKVWFVLKCLLMAHSILFLKYWGKMLENNELSCALFSTHVGHFLNIVFQKFKINDELSR